MRQHHPMITAFLGLVGNAMAVSASRLSIGSFTGKRTRTGSRSGYSDNGMRQSEKTTDIHLRGYAGAKMARKANAYALGVKSGHA